MYLSFLKKINFSHQGGPGDEGAGLGKESMGLALAEIAVGHVAAAAGDDAAAAEYVKAESESWLWVLAD